MFFDDRAAALREMWRVTRSGGRVVVAVWQALEQSPGYADVTTLLARLFGERVAGEMRAPFSLGDPELLRSLFECAGIADVEVRGVEGTARFPSIDAWVHTDIKGWTLADLLDEEQYQTLRQQAQAQLRKYARADGTVEFRLPAYVAVATKR